MAAPQLPSQVDILKTDAAAKKGLGVKSKDTEAVWPKPQFVRLLLGRRRRLARLIVSSAGSCLM